MNGDVAALLRDLVDFLECLDDVELPESQQAAREALLERSRAIVLAPGSPEPYLEMNPGKTMFPMPGDEDADTPQEYIGADEQQVQRGSLQHYYETFQDFQGVKGKENGKTDIDKEIDNVMLLYMGFSATQAKARSAKSGPLLHLRREHKMFAPFNVFWLNKSCWVSLVGSHLLLFTSDRDSRPHLVVPLHGYKSRPAPGALPRDPKRSESAFEVYCPGDRTFQFLAKSTQEMREWVDAVTDSLEPEGRVKTRAATFAEILEIDTNEKMASEMVKEEKEKYQDVLNSPKTKTKEKPAVVKAATPEKEKVAEEPKEEAPPLPARTRRLPSIPSQERISYEPKEETYDEDGLYQKIEEMKAQREYQNCHVRSSQQLKGKKNVTTVDLVQETYDDVEAAVDKSKEQVTEPLETYDDVHNVLQEKNNDEPISYDDIQAVSENLRAKSEKDKSPKKKLSQKLSLFDRVRNRKESMRREDKKPKSPTPSTPTTPITTTTTSSSSTTIIIATSTNKVEPELPCYDDISNLTPKETFTNQSAAEEEDYLSPPPPRPIYSRPPTVIKCAVTDEIYDDIGSCIEMNGNGCKGCANVDVIKDHPIKNSSFLSDLQLSIEQQQHYQVPPNNRKVVENLQEELYDDVALSETFKNRQRESVASPEKSMWSRLGSGKRPRIFDHVTRQSSYSDSTDGNEDSAGEKETKVKPFQKLINKVENTLGKATSKAHGVTQN